MKLPEGRTRKACERMMEKMKANYGLVKKRDGKFLRSLSALSPPSPPFLTRPPLAISHSLSMNLRSRALFQHDTKRLTFQLIGSDGNDGDKKTTRKPKTPRGSKTKTKTKDATADSDSVSVKTKAPKTPGGDKAVVTPLTPDSKDSKDSKADSGSVSTMKMEPVASVTVLTNTPKIPTHGDREVTAASETLETKDPEADSVNISTKAPEAVMTVTTEAPNTPPHGDGKAVATPKTPSKTPNSTRKGKAPVKNKEGDDVKPKTPRKRKAPTEDNEDGEVKSATPRKRKAAGKDNETSDVKPTTPRKRKTPATKVGKAKATAAIDDNSSVDEAKVEPKDKEIKNEDGTVAQEEGEHVDKKVKLQDVGEDKSDDSSELTDLDLD